MVSRRRKAARILVPAAAAAALLFFLWYFGAFLPRWCQWNTAEITEDLDGDGTDETIILKNRHVTVKRGSESLYSFPLLWRVTDVFAADLDKDGKKELILITWKHGSFGRYRPFWVERDTSAFSQHVFVFRLEQDQVRAEWMSSDIGREVARASMDEQDRLHLIERNGTESVCMWDFWGFTMVEEEEKEPTGVAAEKAEEETEADAETPSTSETAAEETISTAAADTGQQTLSIIAVGDNIAHESVNERAWNPEKKSFDYSPIYAEVKEKIPSYDLAIVNQETVFTPDPAIRSGYPLFVTPETMGDALADAGFDIILGATNHCYDNGVRGVEETVTFWEENHPEIRLEDLHNTKPETLYDTVEKNGICIAIFNYTESTNGLSLPSDYSGGADVLGTISEDNVVSAESKTEASGTSGSNQITAGLSGKDRLFEGLREAENECDLSICFLHAGEEYSQAPSSALRAFAEKLIGEGADVLIFSHPHVLQGMEKVRADGGQEGIVWWSLGNFMSHQTDPQTVLGGAAELIIEKRAGGKTDVSNWDLLPTVCHFDGQSTRVYFLEDYSEELANKHSINRDNQQFTLESLEEQAESLCRFPF